MSEPSYLQLARTGELQERAQAARRLLSPCTSCPRRCMAARLDGQRGACQTAQYAKVCNFSPHFGEEAPLVGRHGSGTIFFSGCNLECQFCQNFEISVLGHGREAPARDLAVMMLQLQNQGCHNINLVTPSHVVAPILNALCIAAEGGLHVPIVYNSGGYDALETLRLIDGVVDIYMPDMKYADAEVGARLSGIPDYPAVNRAAVKEMHRQVGDLACDRHGVAMRGLLVRHLVLPEGLAGTESTAQFLAEEISRDTYLNLIRQYRPCHKAASLPPLDRSITPGEDAEALRLVRAAGLGRLEKGA